MSRNSTTQLLAALVLAGCLLASTFLALTLNGIAGRAKLAYTDRVEEGQTWEVSTGIAMGAFRGLFVNWLWMRANRMKEEGKFYEAIQLSDAITRLQPRFPRVWVFHAWNLAYNISVATQTPIERWIWVNRGVSLLRDRGIPANPNDLLLHKELAWIFLHKIGGYTDDSNQFYKRELAREWTIVLGPPPKRDPKNRDRKAAIESYASWIQGIADAPATLDEVIASEPSVATLVQRLKDEARLDGQGMKLLMPHAIVSELRRSRRGALIEKIWGERYDTFKPMLALYDDPALKKAWEALIPHVRRRVLVDVYHMEPERMVRYVRKYGPLDWRLPGAHGLYWGARGVEMASTRATAQTLRDFDFLNTDRMVVQSIQELWRGGDLYFDFLGYMAGMGAGASYQWAPNEHFVRSYGDVTEEVVRRSGIFEDPTRRSYRPLAAGYENFLREAVGFFYRRGEKAKAQEWLDTLRLGILKDPENPKGDRIPFWNLNDPDRARKYSLPLDEFVQDDLREEWTRPVIIVNQVNAALQSAFVSGLLGENDDIFRAQLRFAADAHKHYFSEQFRRTAPMEGLGRMEYLDPDFWLVAGITFANFAQSLSLDDAKTAYLNADELLRNYAHEPLKQRFGEEVDMIAKAEGSKETFTSMFPPPANHEAFMAELRRKIEERNRATGDIEKR